MVQVLDPASTERLPASSPQARWGALVAAVVTGIGLGATGNALVSPGRSLAVPTATVAGIGTAVVLVSWVVASVRAGRQAGWIFAVGVGAVTVLASVWTFEFALPVAVEWSGATAQAQNALSEVQHSPQNRHGTVPPHPCVLHANGSIGPLAAPYRECTIWTPIGHMVSFVASGRARMGVSCTPIGPRRFLLMNAHDILLATGGCSPPRRIPTAIPDLATSATRSGVLVEAVGGIAPIPGSAGGIGTSGHGHELLRAVIPFSQLTPRQGTTFNDCASA